jgi:translation initiation factor IF-2
MSTENTTPRLLAAAKEFNIGKETLVEFLTNKKFEVNASNPNTKLTEDMYFALQAEFAKDKLVKKKSDEIALPKGQSAEARKKAAEAAPIVAAEASPAKEEKVIITAPKVELKVVGKLEEKKAPKAAAQTTAKAKEKEPAPEAPIQAADAVEEAPKKEKKAAKIEEPEHIDLKSKKVDGPNVLGKINLDDLNQSTRPKKSVKKKEEEVSEKAVKPSTKKAAKGKPLETEKSEAPKKAKAEKKSIEEVTVEKTSTPALEINASEAYDDSKQEHIEMKAPKLEGPKIIGKIELPINNGNDNRDNREKRNRKRIPVQKKPESFRESIA